MDKKTQIQKFIASGNTEEALELLAQLAPDAILLQSRYNGAKKQYNMGIMPNSEWSLTQTQINYAALEMAGALKGDPNTGDMVSSSNASTATKPKGIQKKVFISYNWDDKATALEVKKYLEEAGCDVIIDEDDIVAGGSIMQFIHDSIKNCDAVVSIVSGKSLQSGWVGGESLAAMYAVWLADKKFIPIRLDNVVFDIDFQIAAQETLNSKIKELKTKIKKLESLGGDDSAFRDDLNRMNELKNNLGKIIQRFKSVLMLDITGENFTPNMKKVVAGIQA